MKGFGDGTRSRNQFDTNFTYLDCGLHKKLNVSILFTASRDRQDMMLITN